MSFVSDDFLNFLLFLVRIRVQEVKLSPEKKIKNFLEIKSTDLDKRLLKMKIKNFLEIKSTDLDNRLLKKIKNV